MADYCPISMYLKVLFKHLQIQQADFFTLVNEQCPLTCLKLNYSGVLHILNACFPLLDWYLVPKQAWWAGDVLCVDTSSTWRAPVSQLSLKHHAERRFTSPGCNVPTLQGSNLCVWVTVFNMLQRCKKVKMHRSVVQELVIWMNVSVKNGFAAWADATPS